MAVKAGFINWNLLKAWDIYAKIGIGQIMRFFPDFRNGKEYNLGKKLKRERTWQKNISQRKDGLYQARFINRFGKRETIYAKKYSEITKKLRELQYQDEKQLNPVDSNFTLDEWFETWLHTCKKIAEIQQKEPIRYSIIA